VESQAHLLGYLDFLLHHFNYRHVNALEYLQNAAAGRVYQVNFSSLRIDYAGKISVIPMYQGARLSWRNIAPGLAKGSPRIDEEVPYAPNSEHAGPVKKRSVADADRPIFDRIMACAGRFGADIELRKLEHDEYESRFASVGAFVRAALVYVDEEDALHGSGRAQREAMATYAAALVPPEAATDDSRKARVQLKDDLKACADFYDAHRAEFTGKP